LQLVADRIVASTGQAPWTVFSNLDEHLTTISDLAVQRLAHQNQYGSALASFAVHFGRNLVVL
jgi:hypothetical protein